MLPLSLATPHVNLILNLSPSCLDTVSVHFRWFRFYLSGIFMGKSLPLKITRGLVLVYKIESGKLSYEDSFEVNSAIPE